MKIFDGVTVNPAGLDPKWQGVLGVAMLLANTFAEAEKIRSERVEKETAQRRKGATLEEVMEESGLKIAKLQDALTAFMGGDEEAKEVADLIVSTPDPGKLLLAFAKNFKPLTVPVTGPIVTPPPSAPQATPIPAAAPPAATENVPPVSPRLRVAKFRPEFTREGMEAGMHEAAPARPRVTAYRPEFTREGMDAGLHLVAPAARVQTEATPPPTEPAAAPQVVTPPAPSTSAVPAKPSKKGRTLKRIVAARLASALAKFEEEGAEQETRIRCLEAEMEQLREAWADHQAMHGVRPKLVVVPRADDADAPLQPMSEARPSDALEEIQARVPEAEPADVEAEATIEVAAEPAATTTTIEVAAEPAATTTTIEVAVEPAAAASETAPTSATTSAPAPGDDNDDDGDLPDAESDEEVEEALTMIDRFTDLMSAKHAKESARLSALERQVGAMRALVGREPGTGVGHG